MTIDVSASQVKTFRLCPRKWALEKLAGVKTPPNKWAEFGTRVHRILEEWMAHGTRIPETPEGVCAMAALRHLPDPGHDSVDTEFWFEFLMPNVDARFRGFIDLHHENGEGQPVVRDYKTTGDFKWAHTPESLAQDPQAVSYAYVVLTELNPDADYVELEWLYLLRNRSQAHPVRLRVWNTDAWSGLDHNDWCAETTLYDLPFAELEETVREMIKAREEYGEDVMLSPRELTACGAFGGCPHIETCEVTPRERMKANMGNSALVAKLSKTKKAAAEEPKQRDNVNPPKKEETPPAAPQKTTKTEKASGDRDEIATHILAGLASNPARTMASCDELASEAYAYADALLAAK